MPKVAQKSLDKPVEICILVSICNGTNKSLAPPCGARYPQGPGAGCFARRAGRWRFLGVPTRARCRSPTGRGRADRREADRPGWRGFALLGPRGPPLRGVRECESTQSRRVPRRPLAETAPRRKTCRPSTLRLHAASGAGGWHCWLVQQCCSSDLEALLGKPAVAPARTMGVPLLPCSPAPCSRTGTHARL